MQIPIETQDSRRYSESKVHLTQQLSFLFFSFKIKIGLLGPLGEMYTFMT